MEEKQIFLDYMYLGDDSYDIITEEDVRNIQALDEFLIKVNSKENGYWCN